MPHETETQRIAHQLRLLHEGKSWLGPSLQEILGDIDQHQAEQRPIGGAHSILELLLHMTSWMRIACDRISATEARNASPSEDWPSATNVLWPDALSAFDRQTLALQDAIQNFPASRLHEPAPATEPQTFYLLFHGVIQHTAYHAGQIVLLKKS